MRSLPIPDWALADVYEQCVSNAIPLAKRNRLQGIVSRIRDLERSYQWLAEEGRAHRLEVVNFLEGDAGNVEGDEVYGLYDSRLVAKSSSLRSVYDKLRLSSPGNICPYCGQSPVRTIDHYLPRSKLKFLAVSPFNLIPCCRDCNSEKKEFIALNDSDSLIHPYFDRDLSGIEWLYAEIVETDPLALKFSVIDCDDVIVRRASSHFRVFNLAFYYATHSAVELINMRALLLRLYESGGVDSVREELRERLDSAAGVNINSWQAAFYRALHQSDVFCDGGFSAISAPQ